MINALWRKPRRSNDLAQDLCQSYARIFATDDGQRVLEHLWRMTLDQATGPNTTDEHLRHLEGQRYIVKFILNQTLKQNREAPGRLSITS